MDQGWTAAQTCPLRPAARGTGTLLGAGEANSWGSCCLGTSDPGWERQVRPVGAGPGLLESGSAGPVGGAPRPMSPGEKLDPLPDPFILQPPVFHPVSSHSGLEPPGLRAPPPPLPHSSWTQAPPRRWVERPSVLGPAPPTPAHRPWKALLSLAEWLSS